MQFYRNTPTAGDVVLRSEVNKRLTKFLATELCVRAKESVLLHLFY